MRSGQIGSNSSRRQHLSDALLQRVPFAPPGERRRIIDAKCNGLRIEIGTKTKTWRVQWDLPAHKAMWGKRRGKTLNRTLGRWQPESEQHLSVRKARSEAQRFLGLIKSGQDPKEPLRAPGGPTLKSALDGHLATLKRTGRSVHTAEMYRGTIERNAKDWLQRPLSDLATDHGRADVKKRFEEITEDGKPTTANHLARSIRALYNSARKTNLALPPDNPTHGLVLNPERSRANTGLTLKDLPKWFEQLKSLEDPIDQAYAALGLLTGLRPWQELAPLKWSDVSIVKRRLRISRPKGWRENRDNSFDLYLTKQMLRVLAFARRVGKEIAPGSPYIFPVSQNKCGHIDKKVQHKLSAWGHALRHSFASIAEELGFDESSYGPLVLNHSPKGVTGKYPNRPAIRLSRGREILETVNTAMLKATGLKR